MRKITISGLTIAFIAAATLRAGAEPAGAPLADAGSQVAAEPALTLRVNDAVVQPGGVAAAVLRTYRSRGVGSGQVCLAVRARALAGQQLVAAPTITYLSAHVFDPAGDVVTQMTPAPDEVMVQFSTPLPTINAIDGPLAVIYFRVEGAAPGDQFDIEPLLDSYLIDGNGNQIPLTLRPCRLKIADPGEAFDLSAAADVVVPGHDALITLQSKELKLLSSGTLALRFDPSLAAAPPTVRVDPRHGKVTYDTDGSAPEDGLIVVHFVSARENFNRVPGDLLEVTVPTRADIPPGTRSVVRPDTALTTLVDAQGRVLALEFENDLLQFIAP
jgi:hypothetical protein